MVHTNYRQFIKIINLKQIHVSHLLCTKQTVSYGDFNQHPATSFLFFEITLHRMQRDIAKTTKIRLYPPMLHFTFRRRFPAE